ncbi:hypothetical protein A9Q98_08420 [Thalassotalea sp. 42_200_T64]|nr:hypothetical protein A9Q98_08420 [Thalassotalea sp. 42_200_T64]
MINASPSVKYGLNIWLTIALFSLFVANSLAIALIALKVPAFTMLSAEPLFKPFLAYHVNLAMLFWMPAVAGWVWCYFFDLPKSIIKMSLLSSLFALIVLVVSLVDVTSKVSLSNYYPILHSPVFMTALVVQVCSVTLLALFVATKAHHGQTKLFLAKSAAFAWLIFVVAIVVNIAVIKSNPDGLNYFEQILWAPGHLQQIVNGFILASLWACFLKNGQLTKTLQAVGYMTLFTTIAALIFSFIDINSQLSRTIFTWQMSLFSWMPMAAVAGYLLTQKLSKHNNSYLNLSLTVALLGILSGMLITPGNLTVPGHYHGMTGAYNLAFFALLFTIMPIQKNYQNMLTKLYGAGLIMLIVGLTWAGRIGIGRKLIAEQQGILTLNQSVALLMIVCGAALAIIISLLIIKSFLPKLNDLFKINE